ELRDAGYLAVEGATKNRTLAPADPQLRTPNVLSPRTPRVLSGGDLGHVATPDLGHSASDTKSIYIPPEGGEARAREARTREGALPRHAANGFTPPALDTVLTRAKMCGVPADQAEEFFWHYEAEGWLVNGRPM